MVAYYLYKKFLRVLDTEPIDLIVKKLPEEYSGFLESNEIQIDHRKDDCLAIMVHELIHYLFPAKREREVQRLEKWYMEKATWKQKKNLLRYLIRS